MSSTFNNTFFFVADCDENYRTCDICGKPLFEGYTDEMDYCCEEHVNEWMDTKFGKGMWRENDHVDDSPWYGGYYDYKDGDEWRDTYVYWTEWED